MFCSQLFLAVTSFLTDILSQDVDISGCSYEDSWINSDFSLRILRDDVEKINALVLWFQVFFRHGKTPIILSTGIDDPDTHWMQVHLYLGRPDCRPKPVSIIYGRFVLLI